MENQTNPLLSRIQIPGETFRLPSGGLFYTDGELAPGVNNGEVHVRPLTALDEIIIKNPDKIMSGKGVVEVIQRCIPDVADPSRLFAKDVDYLLIALRKVTYGSEIRVDYTHTCKNAKDHRYKFDINEFLTQAKAIDPTTIDRMFKVKMPNGQLVTLKPMRFADVIDMMSFVAQSQNMAYEEVQFKLFDSLTTIVHQVDEINDHELIRAWLKSIPDSWVKKINQSIVKNSDWGVKVTRDSKCQDCGADIKLDVDLNPISFFTIYSELETDNE